MVEEIVFSKDRFIWDAMPNTPSAHLAGPVRERDPHFFEVVFHIKQIKGADVHIVSKVAVVTAPSVRFFSIPL